MDYPEEEGRVRLEEVSKTRAKLERMTIDEPIEKADELREKESELQEGYLD